MTATLTVPLIAPQLLIDSLDTNYRIIQRQVNGLTHEDSLLQLPFRGNCLNWVLGHITQSRNGMLKLLDEVPVWTPVQVNHYKRDSQPVLDGGDALRFETILADLATAQERLVQALGKRTAEDLSATLPPTAPDSPPESIGERLYFLVWHETYHVGQPEILRQLTGINDKVI